MTTHNSIFALVKRDEMIETGARLRSGYLLQQAGYTFGLARQRGAVLAPVLPAGFLDEAEATRAEVEAGLRERTNAAAESRDATRDQNDALRRVREWRRKLVGLGNMARRTGRSVPDELTRIGRSSRAVPTALVDLERSIMLLEQNRAVFAGFPLHDPVLEEGKELAVSLAASDATQESRRLAELPAAVAAFYAAKGKLYTALKLVNDAARSVYAGDPSEASLFNLSILYRGRAARSPAAEAGTHPAAPPADDSVDAA